MKNFSDSSKPFHRSPRGFTLVEMLVATALVVLMMMMFAQVFQTAGGLVSNIKSMAENDQSVRTLTILLRGDIKQRTFVDVVPFFPGQNTASGTIPNFDEAKEKGYDQPYRRGFFSISENNPNDPTDDVLHLTIRTDSPLRDIPQLPFSGRTRLLTLGGTPPDADQYLIDHPDQPEFDDGQIEVNNTGSSRYAEVCWFLRNGNLYRRMLLIRDPYNRGGNLTQPEEPQDSNGVEFIDTFYDPDHNGIADNFWRDFDYSAYWEPDSNPDPNLPPSGFGLKFHSLPLALNNDSDAPPILNLLGFPRSLGIPFLRFGSSISRAQAGSPAVISGPREYIGESDPSQTRFIGRYTIQETVHDQFGYPGSFSAANDPFNSNSGPALSLNANGLVVPYANPDFFRRGEDLVMTNVHEFDIQVWDDGILDNNGRPAPAFVNLGHNGRTGHYRASANPAFGNSYDTWHPYTDMPPTPYAPFIGTRDPSTNGLGEDGEVWLKAIRIKIRFYDVGGEQMRDLTFTFRLNRQNSTK